MSKSVTRSHKAGLQFPVGRIDRHLKLGKYSARTSATASVYLAGVLEYLTAEVLELAGKAALDNKRTRITPRFIFLAAESDEELKRILKGVTISGGGVIPKIEDGLLKRRRK